MIPQQTVFYWELSFTDVRVVLGSTGISLCTKILNHADKNSLKLVKTGSGICLFLHRENGIWVTKTGNHQQKSGHGTDIWAKTSLGNGICAEFG